MLLGKMLAMDPPDRMESFDISNISGTDIVASMVVFEEGKPKKSDYKRFKLEGLQNQDDYASMHQILKRRFSHYKAGDKAWLRQFADETIPEIISDFEKLYKMTVVAV